MGNAWSWIYGNEFYDEYDYTDKQDFIIKIEPTSTIQYTMFSDKEKMALEKSAVSLEQEFDPDLTYIDSRGKIYMLYNHITAESIFKTNKSESIVSQLISFLIMRFYMNIHRPINLKVNVDFIYDKKQTLVQYIKDKSEADKICMAGKFVKQGNVFNNINYLDDDYFELSKN